MKPLSFALVGDFSPAVLAHQAIPLALERASRELNLPLVWRWVRTREVHAAAETFADCDALWLVPNSPYENMTGALAAVRWAREERRPFLGTCGGFQHTLIEWTRHVMGLADADHAESNPSGSLLVITPLSCSLVEQNARIHFSSQSLLHQAYGTLAATEGYHCRYGFNPDHRAAVELAGMRCTAFDDAGAIRGAELPIERHPFFVATLFQPERRALRGETPPLVSAFAAAAAAARQSRGT